MAKPFVALLPVAVLAMVLSGCSAIAGAQPAEVGDCIQIGEIAEGGEVDGVPTVDCGEAHDGQVVHIFDLPDGEFPSNEEVLAAVDENCREGFKTFVGTAFDESTLELNWLSPLEEGWEKGDRSVQCVAYLDGDTTTSTFEGTKI